MFNFFRRLWRVILSATGPDNSVRGTQMGEMPERYMKHKNTTHPTVANQPATTYDIHRMSESQKRELVQRVADKVIREHRPALDWLADK